MLGFLKKTILAIKESRPKQKIITKDIVEDLLLEADVSYETVERIIYYLPPSDRVKKDDLKRVLKAYFVDLNTHKLPQDSPIVELVIGVNGAGKTTTIAKMANFYKKQDKSVMLGASDTFRAAAIEQISLWADKLDIPIVKSNQGHDPSAVAYDTITSAVAKNIDHVIIDTAGRLHNQKNLSTELQKISRISSKAKKSAPHRKVLILDGTQGNACIAQAKAFKEIIDIDAIIITKLDGTAKGGALFSIVSELKLPILYVGIGESEDDLIEFDADEYIDTILDSIFEEESKKD